MSRTWIKYNKPGEPNAIHAGLLLALGLHGYLRVLSLSDIFQYLAQVSASFATIFIYLACLLSWLLFQCINFRRMVLSLLHPRIYLIFLLIV